MEISNWKSRSNGRLKPFCAAVLGTIVLFNCTACNSFTSSNPPADPINITIWTYYNGEQLDSFNELVTIFNDTVGKEQHILVESSSQGNVNDLVSNVMNAALGKVGAAPMPNIFSAYADNAYELDEMGMVVDLSQYFTAEDQANYVDSYLQEGDFDQTGSIKILPIAKATELLFLNDTDWQVFARACDVDYSDLATIEGLLSTADLYYQWTDAQTPEPDDGRALFGRDAMANYLLSGAEELGLSIFEVDETGTMTLNFDRDVIKKLWDSYYVPMIRGRFCATGRYRSDDIKTGNILAYTGSTSSATFFPTRVISSDAESHDITLKVLPAPHFSGQEPVTVQQGAGMVVTTASEEEIQACVTFLKWFTQPEMDVTFSVNSGYLPVSKEANQMETIRRISPELTPQMDDLLSIAIQSINENRLYTSPVFSQGQEARKILEYSLSDTATADRSLVEDRMSLGQSLEEASAEFLTEAHFDDWYTEILQQLQAYAG